MRERELFIEALQKENAAERDAFLDEACAGDDDLRQRVERLLEEHQRQESFILDSPPPGMAATSLHTITEGPGTLIGPYKLLEQIGEGGFGVVYMAEQQEPVRRRVALKVIKPGMDSRQVIARFEAERQALAVMEHPNIAKVLDAGTTESGRPFFVMELVKGLPITDYCDQVHLTPRQRLELFVGVCQAVQHAHQKGIIHRDLKPSNVLVTEPDGQPTVKVIDFGVAKATGGQLTDKTLFTGFAQMIGTPLYMSPEQAGLSVDIDTRSDVYSLGVLLYELLTGATPFDKRRFQEAAYDEIRRIIREEDPPKPSTRLSESKDTLPSIAANRQTEPARLTKEVRGELDWIVMKCLEKDRNRRYETANGLVADIERYLHDEPVQACPPSARYRLGKFARRNKAALVTVAVVAASLVLGTAISIWQAAVARHAETLAESRLKQANSISDLLQQMLGSANPDSAKGVDYTVRQMLDEFSAGLGGQLQDQPEAEAAIRTTIGNAYRQLGLTDKAAPHLEGAVELRKRVLGPDHPEVARSLNDCALNAAESRSFAAAEAWGREALAIHRKRGLRTGATIEILSALQWILSSQDKYEEAQATAQELMEISRQLPQPHPEVASALHRLALDAMNQGDPVKGERLARESVALHRKVHGNDHVQTGWGLFHVGWALGEQKKFAEAEPYYREALAIFRKQFHRYDSSHHSLESVYSFFERTLIGKGDQAGLEQMRADRASMLSEAVTRTNDDVQRTFYRADLHRVSGELDEAIAGYSAVIAQKPDYLKAWVWRGVSYRDKGDFAKAAEDFAQAVQLSPREWWYWSELGAAYQMIGEHEKSIAAYTQVIKLRDSVAEDRLRRGRSYRALGQLDKANADLARAIELNPSNWETWSSRGEIHAEFGEWDKAAVDFIRATELAPDQALVWYRLALVRLAQQDHAGYREISRNLLERAAQTQKPDPVFAYRVAWTCVLAPDAGADPDQVVQLARPALENKPTDPDLLGVLGAALYRAGQFDQAAQRLIEAEAAYAKDEHTLGTVAYPRLFLSMAHKRLDQHEQAQQWLDKAVPSIEPVLTSPPERAPTPWNRRLTLQLLQREAEDLLNVTQDSLPETQQPSIPEKTD